MFSLERGLRSRTPLDSPVFVTQRDGTGRKRSGNVIPSEVGARSSRFSWCSSRKPPVVAVNVGAVFTIVAAHVLTLANYRFAAMARDALAAAGTSAVAATSEGVPSQGSRDEEQQRDCNRAESFHRNYLHLWGEASMAARV